MHVAVGGMSAANREPVAGWAEGEAIDFVDFNFIGSEDFAQLSRARFPELHGTIEARGREHMSESMEGHRGDGSLMGLHRVNFLPLPGRGTCGAPKGHGAAGIGNGELSVVGDY